MAIIMKILERERERELLHMLDKRDLPSDRRKELDDELQRIRTTIEKKMDEQLYAYYIKNNMLHSANELARTGRVMPRTPDEVRKMSEEVVQPETPVETTTEEWPKHAKLVKERVALIEDELYESAKKICKGDPKVLVSALGKVLARARSEKKPGE